MSDFSHLPPPATGSTPAVLVDEPRPKKPRQPGKTWPWIVTAVLILGAFGLTVTNWAVKNALYVNLLTAIEASESEMIEAQDELQQILVAAAEDGQVPDEAQITEISDEIKELGQEASLAIAAKRPAIASQSFPFWMPELVAVQGEYLEHNQAWVDYWQSVSSDPAIVFRDEADSRINSTWELSKEAMLEARPAIPFPEVTRLLDVILGDGDAPNSDGDLIA